MPETMVLLGDVRLRGMVNSAISGLKLGLAGSSLSISQRTPSGSQAVADTIVDLAGWLSQQTQPEMTVVEIRSSHANKTYLLLVTKAEIDDHPPNDVPRILELSGQIFRVLQGCSVSIKRPDTTYAQGATLVLTHLCSLSSVSL